MVVSTTAPRRRRRMMASSLSTALCLAAATCLPNAAFAMEENTHQQLEQAKQQQRQTQLQVDTAFTNEVPSRVSFEENFGQTTETGPPKEEDFNYRSCGSGINQAGFATLEFMYEVETNVSMSASAFLNTRQQQKQEEQLEFLESITFPETLSTAILERLQEKVCGYTFYQPVLEVISMSSGKDDEVWDSCNQTLVESRSCTRYLGSVLIGVNNTSILGSVTTKVAKHIMPVIAADMFEGWYAQWMTDKLASTPVDVNGDPDYVGAVQITKVNFVGVPIFGDDQKSANQAKGSGGKLTGSGYVLLCLGLWLLFSICGWGFWVYRNMINNDEEQVLVEQKTTRLDPENGNNNTFTIEEEEEEEDARATKVLQLPPPPQKARSNSYDDSYARQQALPYKYSDEAPPPSTAPRASPYGRMGILPIEVDTTNPPKQSATPLQTPQATRSPLAHRRVRSAGNNDFYQFHPSTPGGGHANDPRFISVTPRDNAPSGRAFETPASPPRLSYQNYQPQPDQYQPYGTSNSITESHGPGYSNYALDQSYHLTHRLPSSYGHNQELLNNSLPEWATPRQPLRHYDDFDYPQSGSRQPGTTTTVLDSRGRVRKEIAL